MNDEVIKNFLINSDETGRFIVKSLKTGKTYYVEPIDADEKTKWGDYDPATKTFQTSNYGEKYKGSIDEKESLITQENGFTNIQYTGVGVSPLDYINRLDEQYIKEHGI